MRSVVFRPACGPPISRGTVRRHRADVLDYIGHDRLEDAVAGRERSYHLLLPLTTLTSQRVLYIQHENRQGIRETRGHKKTRYAGAPRPRGGPAGHQPDACL